LFEHKINRSRQYQRRNADGVNTDLAAGVDHEHYAPVGDVSAGEQGGTPLQGSDPSRVTKYRGADKGLTGV